MTRSSARVLLVGETTFRIHTHYKGFASYETAYCTLSLEQFVSRFADTRIQLAFMPNHEVSVRFPSSLEAMQEYDAIVISDAPADSFLLHPDTMAGGIRPNRLRLLEDYARSGGAVAMIGGWMSFGGFQGKAHYAYTPLADILPVVIDRGDDRMEVPEGIYPEIVSPSHPILAGLPSEWPDFLGYNRFAVRGGETLLHFKASGDPLLVVDTIGSGRVAAFASDILPHWGSPRFQQWPHFVVFWEQLFLWLSGRMV